MDLELTIKGRKVNMYVLREWKNKKRGCNAFKKDF
jgi:hypothetical protein